MDYICERGDSISLLIAKNMLLIEFRRSKNAALTSRAVKSGISLFPVVKLDHLALFGGQKMTLLLIN